MDPWLGRRIILNTPFRRRIADNLAHIYPDTPQAERDRLTAEIAGVSARNMILLLDNAHLIAEADRLIDIPETPEVRQIMDAHKAGRGVMVISGHYGAFDAGRIGMRRFGIEAGALYRPQNNSYFNAFLERRLARAGQPMFPRSPKGLRDLIRHVKGGGVVAVLIDQVYGKGELLDFMGRPALTSTDPAAIALKQNALVMSGFVARRDDGRFHVFFKGPIAHTDPITMTQEVNNLLSEQIRQEPAEWHWLHRRWRQRKARTQAASPTVAQTSKP